ncbi:heterokaryon incompatibility protein-domain-containing protein [Achaetomium macrosporum]|uniref:Heterokaryon incompatibility protein-domain-containing protein n=1 Tax=Achaetomium macrosporum TaxID=79813 RepID=A0AAN7C7G1_9PEZI|nr:heterokaryon incompatibility protein-domain-containing protein [Achaetomium macrosporum]
MPVAVLSSAACVLINTHSLQLEEFFDASIPKYVILSHTWEKEEVLFSDMADLDRARSKTGFSKVKGACTLAASQGYHYIWIDSCCIDKSSSAELSEAINSMYRWYGKSGVCYAYLCDVNDASQLGDSRWFIRGWTLQELIAPMRASLVDEGVLAGRIHPHNVSVAKRMYWASKRKMTRKEDEAYCLMGLFDVNMPLLYGEADKAFIRLQQEIARVTDDQSILAWYGDWFTASDSEDEDAIVQWDCVWAPSPESFALSDRFRGRSQHCC